MTLHITGRADLQATIEAQRREIEAFREALQGLCDIYAHIWDRVDGCLVLLPGSIDKFEQAQSKADAALAGDKP